MWIYQGLVSALFLGLYDVSRKHALRLNAAMPVIFLSNLCAMAVILPVMAFCYFTPSLAARLHLHLAYLPVAGHALVLAKSAVVYLSWLLSYYSIKQLPVTLAGPIGATAPVWTLLGGVALFGERLTAGQYLGFMVMAVSYAFLSSISGKEGIKFSSNKGVLAMVLASILAATSGLFDKYLINRLGYHPTAVQAWFMIYLVPIAGVVAWISSHSHSGEIPGFRWTLSIPAIGVMLVIADVFYFTALGMPNSLVSVLAMVRASSVVVSFIVGGMFFAEARLAIKSLALTGIVCGLFLVLHKGLAGSVH